MLRLVAAICGLYDAIVGAILLFASAWFASFFGVAPATPPIFSDLASLTGGTTVELDAGFENLPESFLQILERVRQRYLLAFTPTSNAVGWHALEVRVKKSNARVVARRGYLRR